MTLTEAAQALSAEALEELSEHLAALRHDLGKYVCFQQRWLSPNPSTDELRDALDADLRRTRSRGDHREGAVELWARLRPELVGARALPSGALVDLSDEEELGEIDGAIALIARLLPHLGQATRDELLEAGAAAREVSFATKRLLQRVRTL
jgi:hypothetical protein